MHATQMCAHKQLLMRAQNVTVRFYIAQTLSYTAYVSLVLVFNA